MKLCRGCGGFIDPPIVCACLAHACPTCGQPPDRQCQALTTGRTAPRPHAARLQLAHPDWYRPTTGEASA